MPETVRILSLNLAHGRGTGFHQVLTSHRQVRANLDRVAALIESCAADVVALQELDAPSVWSGRFDHLDYLAARSGLAHGFHGLHVQLRRPRLAYGTGVLSRWPISATHSQAFAQNRLDTKGFVLARVAAPGLELSLVSLHLDFKRERERRAQLELLSACLEQTGAAGQPLVVAGDFNCSLANASSCLPGFARRHALNDPGDRSPTFPSRRPTRRLDEVLVSAGLALRQGEVLPDQVSDHLPVLAEVVHAPPGASPT